MVQVFFDNYYDSPLGKMIMKSFGGEKLCELTFEDQKYFNEKEEAKRKAFASDLFSIGGGAEETSSAEQFEKKDLPIFAETKLWLDIYFSGKKPDFTPPLDLQGTDFRRDVWDLLLEIPYGKTASYGDISNKIAKKRGIAKMSNRAVGGAVGHNPVAIIVPCHRVVGTNGSLTGYGGGIERKIKLLEIEQIDMTKFFVPSKGTAL